VLESGWDVKIIKNVYETLLSADMNLKELMALFDQEINPRPLTLNPEP